MLCILLIDDNQADRILAIRHLKQAFDDLEVREVSNPEALVEALEVGQFDLTITDYQLRWSDGLKVLSAIKSRYPTRPVVMYTNSGSEEIAVEGMKIGLSDYVLKGKRVDRLAIAVQESLEKAKLRQQYQEATRQLQLSEARYRTISELTSDFAYACSITPDQKWKWEWLTEAFTRITGYTFEELREQGGFANLVHPEDKELSVQHRLTLLSGQSDVSEFRIITKDEKIRWLRNFGRPKWDETQQRITFVYGAAQDITERKAAEAAIQRQANELTEANRLKDEFLTTLSHELRTPLSAILGWTKLLQSRLRQDETLLRALEIIERNARAQVQIVEDILDVSRIIQGKLHLNRSPTQLIPVIQTSIESMRPAAEAKSIQIRTEFDETIGSLFIDPNRFQQVVWNLLSNAIKFTPEGGRVEIQLEKVRGTGSGELGKAQNQPSMTEQAQLTIHDTGSGIPGNFLPYVFDRFRQVDSSTTRTHQGMGLGLAIVRHLVEMHGGTVQVESAGEGQGSTFTVRLPLSVPLAPAVLQPPKQNRSEEMSPPLNRTQPLKGLTILVVDDDPDTCEIVAVILEQQGADVIAVASVAEALAVLEQLKPDVLVSDIAMPNEDGYSLIHKVRRQLGQSNLPAVALTAYARAEDRIRALSAGFQTHIPKPVEPAELVAAIVNLTGRNEVD